MPVHVGDVYTVQGAKADKAQALKVLEEAAEVFSAWEDYDAAATTTDRRITAAALLQECADVVTAVAGILAAFNMEDAQPLFNCCKRFNEQRGRVME